MSNTSISFAASGSSTELPVTLRPNADADVRNRIKGFRRNSGGTVKLFNIQGTDVTATHQIAPDVIVKTGNGNLKGDGTNAVVLNWSALTNRPPNGDIIAVEIVVKVGDATVTLDTGSTQALTAGDTQTFSNLRESSLALVTGGTATDEVVVQYQYEVYDAAI